MGAMIGAGRPVDAITLFVADAAMSRAFYERVFETEPIHVDDVSAAFRLGDGAIVNLLALPAADELIAPAAPSPDPGVHRLVLTVGVDDVDVTCRELEAGGVELLNGPLDRPWGIRTAAFADPDGHIWEIAHSLG
jgi:catechol 2,3-dioxygenase-like lactoylglutathione lyase family enzyme